MLLAFASWACMCVSRLKWSRGVLFVCAAYTLLLLLLRVSYVTSALCVVLVSATSTFFMCAYARFVDSYGEACVAALVLCLCDLLLFCPS